MQRGYQLMLRVMRYESARIRADERAPRIGPSRTRPDWSIERFVCTAVQIGVGAYTLTAEDPLPSDLRDALAQVN